MGWQDIKPVEGFLFLRLRQMPSLGCLNLSLIFLLYSGFILFCERPVRFISFLLGKRGFGKQGSCVVFDCIILLKPPNVKKGLAFFPTASMSDSVPSLSLGGG